MGLRFPEYGFRGQGLTVVRNHFPTDRRLRACKRLTLAFDFDGTLAKLAPTPRQAAVSKSMREALVRLERVARISIVSSRPSKVLKKKLGFLKRAIFYGLHGQQTPRRSIAGFPAGLQGLARAKKIALQTIGAYKGAWIESKPTGFTVHFRAVAPGKQKKLEASLLRILKSDPLRLYRGRKAVEVVPAVLPSKAKTLKSIRARLPPGTMLLFFGDDDADEEAFAALQKYPNVLCVAVGRKRTSASLSVKGPRGVERFVREIIKLRSLTNQKKSRPV